MEQTAAQILVAGGLLNLLIGLVTGIPLGLIREKNPEGPKYLRFAHSGALMWAPILFGLVVVLPHSALSEGTETIAAILWVAASVLLEAKDIWHWLRGTKDEFAEKPAPLYLGHLMTLAYIGGLGILSWGVAAAFLAPS